MITILLATYNGEKYLKEQLDSLFDQTYKAFTILARDDCSTDSTLEILESYEVEIIPSTQKLGASQNFNAIVEYALEDGESDYYMFCDQDDVWLPDKIERTLKKMIEVEKRQPDIPLLIHTDLSVVNSNLEVISNSFWKYHGIDPKYNTLNRLLLQNVITGCSVMINKRLAEMATPVPKDAIMHDWWFGLVASAFGEVHYVDSITLLYRQHADNEMGASFFSMQMIFYKALHLSSVDLSKYMDQASVLLLRFGGELSDEQTALLKDFVSMKNMTWSKSKQILLNGEILKQGIARNIGLLLCR